MNLLRKECLFLLLGKPFITRRHRIPSKSPRILSCEVGFTQLCLPNALTADRQSFRIGYQGHNSIYVVGFYAPLSTMRRHIVFGLCVRVYVPTLLRTYVRPYVCDPITTQVKIF